MSRKNSLWRCHRKNPENDKIRQRYHTAHQYCRNLLRDYELKLEQEIIDADNLGKFYRFVNNRTSCKSGIGTLIDAENKPVIDDRQKASLLNDFFATAGTVDNGVSVDIEREVPDSVSLDNINFSPEAILRAIRKIKPKTMAGPDGYSSYLSKKIGNSLAFPLSIIFSSFLVIKKIPLVWKQAIVTPIYKSGIASDPGNYRPIALTSVFSKLMERVVLSDVLCYCKQNKLITEQQHGFLARRSTVTNLLYGLNDWSCAIMNRQSTAVAYIDFRKAFDSVCHSKLLTRLSALGIVGNLLEWIRDFLSDRQQCTRVGCAISDPVKINSGVIQGSCLGPILFLLYINSIVKIFNNDVTCLLFADDVKLYTVLNTDADINCLQEALNRVTEWSAKWQLPISVKKCSIILYGNRNNKIQPCQIDNCTINYVNVVKDLGITINSTLKFNEHIDIIVAKAKSRAYLIRKCFISRNPEMLMQAFNIYVRPLLESASSVWSPQYIGGIEKVESVQRRFTKRLRGFTDLDYPSRLAALGQFSLEKRRLVQDLVLTYKILFGLLDVDSSKFFTLRSRNGTKTRGNPYKIIASNCRINARQHYFSERITPIWNSLPPSVVDFNSLSSFKRTISNVSLNLYTKF